MPSEDDDQLSAEAQEAAERIAVGLPTFDWIKLPAVVAQVGQFLTSVQAESLSRDVRRALTQAYFHGLIYGWLTVEASSDANGLVLSLPLLAEHLPPEDARRLLSYESLLPFLERPVTPREAAMLADRFRGLAALCEAHRHRPADHPPDRP